jgi:hypothetical protein
MANILGIQAFSSDVVLKQWWEWTLVAIIGASALIGVIAFVWTSYGSIRKLLRVRSPQHPSIGAVELTVV